GKGSTTNNFGYFNLTIPAGETRLVVGYLGYSPRTVDIRMSANRILTFRLQPNSLLQEIIVNADPDIQPGRVHVPAADKITLSDLQRSVHLGGASDLYRAADFIPGIQTGTD